MTEINQETGSPAPVETGGKPAEGTPPAAPAATPPSKGSDTATGDEETITLKKADYNNLVGGRDRSNEELSGALSYIERQAQKDGIEKFLKDNGKDYPDLSYDDLSHVEDPRTLEAEAKRIQTRLQDHAQSKILEIENHRPPQETADQRATREAELAKNPSNDAWEKVLEGRMR